MCEKHRQVKTKCFYYRRCTEHRPVTWMEQEMGTGLRWRNVL